MDEILAAYATADEMFDALQVMPVLFVAPITQHLQGQYQDAFNQARNEQQHTHTSVDEHSAPKNVVHAKVNMSFEKSQRVRQVIVNPAFE